MKNPIVKYTVLLGCITLAITLLLSVTNKITKPIIEQNAAKQRSEAMNEVLPIADDFRKITPTNVKFENKTTTITGIYEGFDKNSNSMGYVISVTSHEGYAGDIEVMAGITSDGAISHVKILSMSETPGLGAKAKDDKFIGQYKGKKSNISVIKTGSPKDGEIAAISGATITSKAVTSAVNACIEAVGIIISSKSEADELKESAQSTLERVTEETNREMHSGETEQEMPEQPEQPEAAEPDQTLDLDAVG